MKRFFWFISPFVLLFLVNCYFFVVGSNETKLFGNDPSSLVLYAVFLISLMLLTSLVKFGLFKRK